MGRRSINTTKSGKYMNPTDQARKEARKKELKKNKRQRQMVRAAVLKMKDPTQILNELQKIDEMEYNVLQPSPLNEKVLKEKRKKLRETFDRVLKMYDKDDPEKWVELKRQEMEYDKRRAHLISYYESVKHAQSVQVDDIPLPTLQVPDNLIYSNVPSQIPLPMDSIHSNLPVRPILKKDSVYRTYYMNNYYTNTLCRAAPFFVGMITGYILNMYKGKKLKINPIIVLVSWVASLTLIAFCFYASYATLQLDWDNQMGDSLFNSFIRTIWATGLSWIIFASAKGYGGPIGWFLSLNVWKLPARISFAIYLYHYSICFIVAGMDLAPAYFDQGGLIYDSIAIFALTFGIAFAVTVFIDAPFSVLIKMLMEKAQRRPPKSAIGNGTSKPGPMDIKTDIVITHLDKSRPFDNNIHHLEKKIPLEQYPERQLPNLKVSDQS